MYNSPFYVKFRPFDENTLIGLINQSIRFSTVYDFNDFSEFSLIGFDEHKNEDNKSFLNSINQEIRDGLNQVMRDGRRMQMIMDKIDRGNDTKEFIKSLRVWYYNNDNPKNVESLQDWYEKNKKEYKENIIRSISEHLAYASLGILSLSKISVFDKTAAMVMFAHYAKSLAGVALIYKHIPKPEFPIHDVEYPCQNWNSPTLTKEDYEKILQGNFSGHPKTLLTKDKIWEYEHEARMFYSPGDCKLEEIGLELKAIFYTSRLPDHQKEALDGINKNFYGDALFLEEIYKNYQRPPKFMILNEDNTGTQTVTEWLKTLS